MFQNSDLNIMYDYIVTYVIWLKLVSECSISFFPKKFFYVLSLDDLGWNHRT